MVSGEYREGVFPDTVKKHTEKGLKPQRMKMCQKKRNDNNSLRVLCDSEGINFVVPKSLRKKNISEELRSNNIHLYAESLKGPEGHNPKGTTFREALRGDLPLSRGVFGGLGGDLFEGSVGVCGVLRGPLGIFRVPW